MRRFRVTIVVVEMQLVLNILSMSVFLPYLSGIKIYLAVYYIVYCSLPCSTTFTTSSHKSHDFWKNVNEYKISILIGLYKSYPFFNIELEYSRQISEKYSNIRFHKFLSSGSQGFSFGQTVRQDRQDRHMDKHS